VSACVRKAMWIPYLVQVKTFCRAHVTNMLQGPDCVNGWTFARKGMTRTGITVACNVVGSGQQAKSTPHTMGNHGPQSHGTKAYGSPVCTRELLSSPDGPRPDRLNCVYARRYVMSARLPDALSPFGKTRETALRKAMGTKAQEVSSKAMSARPPEIHGLLSTAGETLPRKANGG